MGAVRIDSSTSRARSRGYGVDDLSVRRPVLWREVVLGLLIFAIYSAVNAADGPARRLSAAANARDVLDLERSLRIDIEPALNSWLQQHSLIRVLSNYEYAFTYLVSAALLLGYLYRRQPRFYRWARNWFAVLNLLAILCFALYPLTPPRLMPEFGVSDTVARGHTWGSWGSGMVDHANEFAAMPSLHFAWALWVSVVLALISGTVRTQLVSCVHVLITLFVILATGNHYLLDAVGAALLIAVSMPIAAWISDRTGHHPWRPPRVSAADVFFLRVESPAAPQHVGGLVLLDIADKSWDAPTRDDLVALVRSQLPNLPRFRQRLSTTSAWRRPRWIDDAAIDWDWHVDERDLRDASGKPAGIPALNAVVAEVEATLLPKDRPLWRMVVVHGVTAQRSAVILVVHHVVADGFGTVAQALHLLEPVLPTPQAGSAGRPGAIKTMIATAAGLAQLATDGRPQHRIPGADTPQRAFGTVALPLDEVRDVARVLGARVTDVLLTVIAGGVTRVVEPSTSAAVDLLRTSVPLMVRMPDAAIETNVTAAVMLDLPLVAETESDRLTDIAGRSSRLRTGSRALASRFVMNAVGEVLPPVGHAWFARTVYGWRYFHAIVSNMPGPDVQLTMARLRLDGAYPILPLAPGAPLAIGALGWTGRLCLGISAHPSLVSNMPDFEAAVVSAFRELQQAASDHAAARLPDTGSMVRDAG